MKKAIITESGSENKIPGRDLPAPPEGVLPEIDRARRREDGGSGRGDPTQRVVPSEAKDLNKPQSRGMRSLERPLDDSSSRIATLPPVARNDN